MNSPVIEKIKEIIQGISIIAGSLLMNVIVIGGVLVAPIYFFILREPCE